ncbi:3-hydroxyacyl-CoA dehydrogenase [Neorhizobium galegae]|uniref:3-hydroxyacyl-CoA dehydrogenase NAD-binding domain-containing protein n=1 Tax=Neorhizobium galegae TaxID=399 RepID=UPI00278B8459|nr:3-hydroxyacyl-CoA dehydrogenase NAD-binding domain-containing protein [Neorhizobium galegae]MDQ0137756.1 3-hydroxyacyl-CoA dehydrogenase [Neorhizobium galegae]
MSEPANINAHVAVERDRDIAIVWIDNPPVNALSTGERAGIIAAVQSLGSEIAGVVIACRGRTFIAGADINEFGRPPEDPTLPSVVAALENLGKPTIAAIHGTAFGGGLELSLGCDYRIASPDAKLGLPEVLLGFIPGSGGTVRLPYLVGAVEALAMIVTGKPVSSSKALSIGLIDAIASSDNPVAEAIALLRRALSAGATAQAVRHRRAKIEQTDLQRFEEDAARLVKRSSGLLAPSAAVEAIRHAINLPFEEALKRERDTFETLKRSDQSKALRHLFFAERAALKVEGGGSDVQARPIARVGIIGGGTMGTGIAMAFANAGYSVDLLDLDNDALARAEARVEQNYAVSVTRGSITEAQKDERVRKISFSKAYDSLSQSDLIIEAAFEDLGVKREIFSKLDGIVRRGAILATNTSYLDVNEIAAATGRPDDVAGAHFFSPANVMKLVEIVRADHTKPEVLKTLIDLAKRIGKVPVVVGVCRGFVGNRMLAARSAESMNLLMEGASLQEVDKAFTDFGWPMGPFQMQDLAGLDISWRNRKSLGQSLPIADDLCELGRFGQKAGRGYYIYEESRRGPIPDPEVEALIEAKSGEKGIVRRKIEADEIIERTLYPMINEGLRILDEKIASRASDIDLVWVHGYGFPQGKGGPMHWGEAYGMDKISDALAKWHSRTGRDIFRPLQRG